MRPLASILVSLCAATFSESVLAEERAHFDAAIAAVGDVDGGGVPDLAVALETGSVLYSGETGAVLWRSTARATSFASIGDFDGDGVRDVAAAFVELHVVSGATGAILATIGCGTMLEPGLHVDPIAVVDGFDELLVESASRVERISLRPGAARAPVRPKRPESSSRLFRALPDTNGHVAFVDWGDIVMHEWSMDGPPSRLRVRREHDVVDLATLCENAWEPDFDDPCAEGEGKHELATTGDVDGDGRADVLVATVGASVRAISTRDGNVLATFVDALPGGYPSWFGGSLASLGDLDGDRVDDVAIGCRDERGGVIDPFVSVHSGKTGARLAFLPHEHDEGHDTLVAAAGDVDRDGRTDLAVLVPQCGALTVYSSASFEPIRVLHPPGVRQVTERQRTGRAPSVEETRSASTRSGPDATRILEQPTPTIAKRDAPVPPRPRFGEAIAAVGDTDGDGVRDLAVAIAGGLALYSSRTGEIRWRSPGAIASVAPIEDVDRDGTPDVIAGGYGTVRVLSGKDGRELAAVREPSVESFGRDVDSLGDLDGDGRPEILIASDVAAVVVSTSSSTEIARLSRSDELRHGHPTRAVGDVDGDGSIDFGWFDSFRSERGTWRQHVRIVSGRARTKLASIDPISACGSWLGQTLAPAGDVDRDGRGDVLVSSSGCAQTYSGRDGRVLATFDDPMPGGYFEGFGDTAVVVGDLDGDGVGEIAFGCKEYMDSGDSYYAAVFDGRTGAKLHVFEHDHWPGHFHFVAAPGDVGGDGVPDIAVLVPECGSLTIYSGQDFRPIRVLHPPDR